MADVLFFTALTLAMAGLAAALRWLHRRDAGDVSGIARLVTANMLLLALLLCTLLAGVELWFRFGIDASDGLAVTRVGEHWFERHWRLNGVGVRDDVEYGERGGLRIEPRPGVKRLTFVGDSVTAAQGVPDVSNRFANRVRAALGPRYEVQVFAQGGLETGDEMTLLNDLFERGYRTDLVVLVYFPNDITDLVPDWQSSLTELLTEPSWLHAAVRGSYALDFLWWRVHLLTNPGVRGYWPMLRDAYEGAPWTAQQERLLAIRRRWSRAAGTSIRMRPRMQRSPARCCNSCAPSSASDARGRPIRRRSGSRRSATCTCSTRAGTSSGSRSSRTRRSSA